jgi:hypothetical protein
MTPLGAYELGQRRSTPRRQNRYARRLPFPQPIEVLLEYRNATGFKTRRKIRIIGFQPRRYGRSYIFAMSYTGPRLFPVDRIVSIATRSGEVLDLDVFLAERFGELAKP